MITRYSLMILLFATAFSLSISWSNVHITEEPPAPSHKEAFQTRLEENFKPNSTFSPFTPVRICIPAVRLSAKVIPVGLQKDGRLGVPKSSHVVGYYRDGVLPGEPGNALMAGHVDDYKGPGIFYPLKKVKPGSIVLLFDANDNVLVYRVEQN